MLVECLKSRRIMSLSLAGLELYKAAEMMAEWIKALPSLMA